MPNANKAVVVSGASSGIGFAIAQTLAQHGFAAFAGVRTQSDADRLQSLHENIRPVILDVRNATQIENGVHAVRESGCKLAGIVNNAGIVVAGPLEYVPVDDVREGFDVNVFGALAMTQAFLPLLRRTRGRVIFMSSVSGRIAAPYVGAYAASKFALEAMAAALRMELAPFGVSVCVIAPGNVKTPIWRKGREAKDALLARLPRSGHEFYGEAIERLVRLTEREERTGVDASLVAQSVLEALTVRSPLAHYVVGTPPAWQRRMAALLPERWRDRLVLKNFRR